MSSIAILLERMKSLNFERLAGLRPRYPEVAVEIDPETSVPVVPQVLPPHPTPLRVGRLVVHETIDIVDRDQPYL